MLSSPSTFTLIHTILKLAPVLSQKSEKMHVVRGHHSLTSVEMPLDTL